MNQPTYHDDVEQGTDEWLALRCGRITASEVKKLLTSKNQLANNATSRGLIDELAAQRITNYVEPRYISDDMLRGHVDEIYARVLYGEKYAPVTQTGIVTREITDGVTIGASPDGLVGDDGLIEVKSRIQREHVKTILAGEVPEDYIAQIQTQLLVTGREWCDFISYCGGLPMFVHRVHRDEEIMQTITEACISAEVEIQRVVGCYVMAAMGLHPTERVIEANETII
jgi:hypothetical protein